MVTVINPATLTITQASVLLGISRNYAFELAAKGELPGARKLGNRWLVSRRALEAFIDGTGRLDADDR
jgi:excisionase family DNA binding protein